MTDKEKKSLIEALLFVSGEPVTLSTLKNTTELPENDLKRLLDELIAGIQTERQRTAYHRNCQRLPNGNEPILFPVAEEVYEY